MSIFKGWIPTITGNLSFSTIGIGRNPPKLFQKFHAFEKVHYTVVAQKRRTSDSPFGYLGDWLDWCRSSQGYTVFVFFGLSQKINGHSTISGPCIELSHETYLLNEEHLKKLTLECNVSTFETFFYSALEAFRLAADEPSGVVSSVDVHRNGQATIEVDDELNESVVDQKTVASQVYFFLRDVCHVHQHHADSSDTITDVTDCTSEQDAWKRETLYSLYRWVIQQKRTKRVEGFSSAKGVLSYAHTFQKIHPVTDINYNRHFLREATVESIEAGLEKATYEQATRGRFFEVLFTRTLPLLAFFLAVLTTMYSAPVGADLTSEQILISQFSHWFSRHAISVTVFVLAVCLVYTIAFINFRTIYEKKYVLDLMRLALVFPKKMVLAICAILVSTLLLIAIALFEIYGISNLITLFVADPLVSNEALAGPR